MATIHKRFVQKKQILGFDYESYETVNDTDRIIAGNALLIYFVIRLKTVLCESFHVQNPL